MKTKSKSKPVDQVVNQDDRTAKEKKRDEDMKAYVKEWMPAICAAANKLYGDKGYHFTYKS